jgi:hypothetical protein
MFQLDDNLLQELGLGSLPAAEKNKMLAHIYETLELRVGMRLAEQMSDQQLDEFEGFIDGNLEHARNYLNTNVPGWEHGQDYQKQAGQAQAQGVAPETIIPEFAALKWLEKNFPDYKKVVGEELEKLKGEIKLQAPAIVQATMSAMSQQGAMQSQQPQAMPQMPQQTMPPAQAAMSGDPSTITPPAQPYSAPQQDSQNPAGPAASV